MFSLFFYDNCNIDAIILIVAVDFIFNTFLAMFSFTIVKITMQRQQLYYVANFAFLLIKIITRR